MRRTRSGEGYAGRAHPLERWLCCAVQRPPIKKSSTDSHLQPGHHHQLNTRRAHKTHRQQLDAGTLNPATGCASLSGLRDAGLHLSSRGTELIATAAGKGEVAAATFVAVSRGQPLGRQSSIACMETIKQSVDEVGAHLAYG